MSGATGCRDGTERRCRTTSFPVRGLLRQVASGAALVGIALLCVCLGPGLAEAAAPAQQGWWWLANPGLGVAPPAPPDVPDGGLYVQGGSSSASGSGDSSPVAFSALVFAIPDGSNATTLVLQIASGSVKPAPALELCPLTAPKLAKPEQGGAMADAPAYSCNQWVTAGPDSAGSGYRFAVANMVRAGVLAVAVLPTSPLDRVALRGPGSSSLVVEPAPRTTVATSDTVPSGTGLAGGTPDTIPVASAGTQSGVPTGAGSSTANPVGVSGSVQTAAPPPALAGNPTAVPVATGIGSRFAFAGRPSGPAKVSFWVAFVLPLVLLAGAAYLGWAFTVPPDRSGPPPRSPTPTQAPRAARTRAAVPVAEGGF